MAMSLQDDLHWLGGWLLGTGWPESTTIAKLVFECAIDPPDKEWSGAKRRRCAHTVRGWLSGMKPAEGVIWIAPKRVGDILDALAPDL